MSAPALTAASISDDVIRAAQALAAAIVAASVGEPPIGARQLATDCRAALETVDPTVRSYSTQSARGRVANAINAMIKAATL